MKTYERDDKVNYNDLSGGGIGEVKGHGPIGEYTWERTDGSSRTIGCGQVAQTTSSSCFHLNVECYNSAGGGGNEYVYSVLEALQHAHSLRNEHYDNVLL